MLQLHTHTYQNHLKIHYRLSTSSYNTHGYNKEMDLLPLKKTVTKPQTYNIMYTLPLYMRKNH